MPSDQTRGTRDAHQHWCRSVGNRTACDCSCGLTGPVLAAGKMLAVSLSSGADPRARRHRVKDQQNRRIDRGPVGQALHDARIERGVHVGDLAQAAGLSGPQVSAVLCGRERITPELAVAAERLLGIDALELIRLDNEQLLAKRLTRVLELRLANA